MQYYTSVGKFDRPRWLRGTEAAWRGGLAVAILDCMKARRQMKTQVVVKQPKLKRKPAPLRWPSHFPLSEACKALRDLFI